jgi:hypothetical protein
VYWLVSTGLCPCSTVCVISGAVRLAVAAQQNMLLLKPTLRLSCAPNRIVPLANGL